MTTNKSYSLLLNAGKPNTLDANAEKALSLGAKEAFAVAIAKDGGTFEFKTVEDLWRALKSFSENSGAVIKPEGAYRHCCFADATICTSDPREMKP